MLVTGQDYKKKNFMGKLCIPLNFFHCCVLPINNYIIYINFFSYDEVQWSEYFPLDRVLDGLFELCRRLYGIRILEMPNRANLWHPDVKYYEILHENDPSIVAGFYLDLCSRYIPKLIIN